VAEVRAFKDLDEIVTIQRVDDFGNVEDEYKVDLRKIGSRLAQDLADSESNLDKTWRIVRQAHAAGESGIKRAMSPAPSARPRPPAPPPPAPVATPTASPPPSNGGGLMTDEKTKRPARSCTSCPNFLSKTEAPKRYGKSIGTPMCAFFNKPLGRSTWEPSEMDRAFTKVGTACDAFGKAAASKPTRTFGVAFPDLKASDDIDATKKAACSSCVSCKNYTPTDVVMSELGWVAGLCNAKGELVQDHSTTFVGRNCDIRQFGEVRTTAVVGLNLFPEYTDDFVTPDLIGDFKKKHSYNPSTHETDKPVTPEDAAHGIKAWRLIRDKERPELDTKVYLPVFDPMFFPESERVKIPQTGEDAHPELYMDHANAVYRSAVLWGPLDETPMIWGEAGNGKTELSRHLAWMMQVPYERISITATTELDDLAGKMHYTAERGTHFKYGRLPKAWAKPGVVCLDEPNVGPPEVWQFIRPLTDNSKQLVLDMNEGELINRNDDCYLMLTANPAWDPRNVGTNPIGDADQRRLMHIFMPPPPKQIEEEIITERCILDGYKIPKVVLNAVMSTAKDLRGLSELGSIPITWGVAPNIKVARATRWFDLITAYKIAVTDFLEPSQAQTVLDAVRANAPSTLLGGGGKPSTAPW
jgi:MoxR-like ATPase